MVVFLFSPSGFTFQHFLHLHCRNNPSWLFKWLPEKQALINTSLCWIVLAHFPLANKVIIAQIYCGQTSLTPLFLEKNILTAVQTIVSKQLWNRNDKLYPNTTFVKAIAWKHRRLWSICKLYIKNTFQEPGLIPWSLHILAEAFTLKLVPPFPVSRGHPS